MRPRRAETSEPACVKRKMLSTKNRTSAPDWSRNCSAIVEAGKSDPGAGAGGGLGRRGPARPPSTLRCFWFFGAGPPQHVVVVVGVVGRAGGAGDDAEASARGLELEFVYYVEYLLRPRRHARRGTARPPCVGGEQVDDLDAGHEDRRTRSTGRRSPARGQWMGRRTSVLIGALLVDGVPDDVHDPAKRRIAHRHRDRTVGVGDLLTADETLRRVHRDAAHGILAEVLGDLEHEGLAVVVGGERVQNLGQFIVELHVADGADHLGDFAFCICH